MVKAADVLRLGLAAALALENVGSVTSLRLPSPSSGPLVQQTASGFAESRYEEKRRRLSDAVLEKGLDRAAKLDVFNHWEVNGLPPPRPTDSRSDRRSSEFVRQQKTFSDEVLQRGLKRAQSEAPLTALPVIAALPQVNEGGKKAITPKHKKDLERLVLLTTDLTGLEVGTVKPATAILYARAVEQFSLWRNKKNFSLRTDSFVDAAMAKYVNLSHKEEEGIDAARRVLYGYNFLHGRHHKPLNVYPRTARAIRGWAKKRPPRSRLGCPWEVTCLLAEDLISRGHPRLALGILLAQDCHFRPEEWANTLHRNQIYAPQASGLDYMDWVVELFPSEEGDTSKVGDTDTSTLVDGRSRDLAREAIAELYRGSAPGQILVPYTQKEVNAQLRVSSNATKTAILKTTAHDFRHGGAAGDLLRRARDQDEVQGRGHWRALSSVRRYGKKGQLAKQMSKLPGAVRSTALGAPARLKGRLAGLLG